MIADIIRAVPKWLVIIAFFVLVIFMVISISFGRFSIANYEFGFGPKGVTNLTTFYSVEGNVKKEDQKPTDDIWISPQWPPILPAPDGELVNVKVWKDPDGKFPSLAFSNNGYQLKAIDLNNKAEVEQDGDTLKIKRTIVLKPIPQ